MANATKLPAVKMDSVRYAMLIVAMIAQLVTVGITWPLWNLRDAGVPNLPLFPLLEIDFGILVVASTGLVLLFPKWGIWVSGFVLLLATNADQVRAQPQILGNWLLMWAAISPNGMQFVRLYLMAMWFWTGLHKMISPDWMTHSSCWMLERAGWNPDHLFRLFAIGVAISEIGLGALAWWRPRWASVGCPLLHGGIALFLSPLCCDWNYSVIPWNVAIAIVGCWLFWNWNWNWKATTESKWNDSFLSKPILRRFRREQILFAALMLLPVTFYFGWINHRYAHVLYSEHTPRGQVTRADGSHFEIFGWGELAIPFPNERGLLKQYFEATSQPGDKLHISDPRRWLSDQYFQRQASGVIEITGDDFFQSSDSEPVGVGIDSKPAVFLLAEAKITMLIRAPGEMVYAVKIPPQYYRPELLRLVAELPNLEEIQLAGTNVRDQDLLVLKKLKRLKGIGLVDTLVTQAGLDRLRSIATLEIVESDRLTFD